jgi:glycosyltransferase involved in cell wall biosynthesis
MNIAFLNFYQGHIDRGAETFVQELAQRLSEKHKVTVFQAGPSKKNKFKSIQKKVHLPKIWPNDNLPDKHILKRLFLHYYKRKELLFTLKCLKDLWRIKPEIIIPLNSGWQALIISIYCRLAGAKMVIAGQSGPGWDDRFNLLTKPHAFVALTQRQVSWAKKATPWFSQKVVKIPNGVDLKKFNPQGKKIKLTIQNPIVLMVAATVPYKRVEQGIAAVSRLKQGSLLLLGKGPQDKRVDSLGYKLLGKARYQRLTAPFAQMPDYYRSADLFTLCSGSTEAFGIVYLEAMASGLACVGTDDLSRQEIIGKAGLFVKNPDNVNQYSQVLGKALKTKWGNLPLKQAQKFSWDKAAQKYQDLFTKLT